MFFFSKNKTKTRTLPKKRDRMESIETDFKDVVFLKVYCYELVILHANIKEKFAEFDSFLKECSACALALTEHAGAD